MPALAITQWREYGDDEDSLDVRLVADELEEPLQIIAAEHDLEHDQDVQEDGPGLAMSINSQIIIDGEEFCFEGKHYRIRFEEVK